MKKKHIDQDKVRVIKIGKEALFEFIYENFVAEQGDLFDVEPTSVCDYFDINYERGEFIFLVCKNEDENGNILCLPKETYLKNIMKKIPYTTDSMFSGDVHYREYTKEELISLSKSQE